ncbi:MAG: hypothetical protein M3N98_02310 [Actinomycetota bacterium]|nr:hypothetical protein [Actinomycetota bacterium]
MNLFSTPVLLATTTADASGNYRAVVTIPATTTPGAHTIVVSVHGGAIQAQLSLTVTAFEPVVTNPPVAATSPGAFSFTGTDIRGPASVATGLLVLGIVVLGATRRSAYENVPPPARRRRRFPRR